MGYRRGLLGRQKLAVAPHTSICQVAQVGNPRGQMPCVTAWVPFTILSAHSLQVGPRILNPPAQLQGLVSRGPGGSHGEIWPLGTCYSPSLARHHVHPTLLSLG